MRLTEAQSDLLALFASGQIVVVIRPLGARKACQIVPMHVDKRWRERHGKPVQEHTLTNLVKRKLLVRKVDDGMVIWRLVR